MNKFDEAITKLENLRTSIDEELAVVRADAVAAAADSDKGDKGDDRLKLNGYGSNSTNPFYKLRRPDGNIDKAIEKKIGDMISAMGHKSVADIARAAKSPAAPMGLTLTGLPLRP